MFISVHRWQYMSVKMGEGSSSCIHIAILVYPTCFSSENSRIVVQFACAIFYEILSISQIVIFMII